jgi:hypothetical protein
LPANQAMPTHRSGALWSSVAKWRSKTSRWTRCVAWLAAASPRDRDAVLATNRSYIFFAMTEDTHPDAGPVAAAGYR